MVVQSPQPEVPARLGQEGLRAHSRDSGPSGIPGRGAAARVQLGKGEM